ncbi:MAG: ABC transporter permease [Clostridiales bacterium]|nr:ABC transporter permease [Clostridiales bacterium]
MFRHIFIYRLKVLMKNKTMLFWTLVFPIALAAFFKLSFGGLVEQGTFRAIDVVVVEQAKQEGFMDVMESLSTGDEPLFDMTITELETAKSMLEDETVAAIITVDETIGMTVNQSGFGQSIVKSFLDQYNNTADAVSTILTSNPSAYESIANDLRSRVTYTVEEPITDAKMDITLNYFYALIAMASLYGSFFGMEEVSNIQANLSVHAARVNVAPVHKLKTFLYSTSASFLIQYSEMLVFLAYLRYILNVDFGDRFGLILVTTFVGSLVGLSLGAFVSALLKSNEDVKTGILIGTTMTGSFLAGMMFGDMKYIVQTKFPIVAILNPVNLLSDAYYALYFYDDYVRYSQNIMILLIFSFVFCAATYMIIRRRKYASL